MAMLGKWFGTSLYQHYFDEELNAMPRKHELRSGICIHGHFNRRRKTGVLDYYPGAEQFITIVRDPFEMAVARYFYAKGLGDNRFKDGKPNPIQARCPDVKTYLGRKKYYLVDFLPYEVTLDNYEEMFEQYFVYVGITEDLQTSVDMLAQRLGFASVPIERLNTSVHDEEVTAEIREEFVSTHPLEYAIYE